MGIDILIKGGRVIDGAGNPWFYGDVAVKGNKIAGVGRFGSSSADHVIDAAGLVVCPGFIDVHTHSDLTLLINPKAESRVRQGITFDVMGNCGFSAAPLSEEALQLGSMLRASDYGIEIKWSTLADYLNLLENQGVALNVATLVGHNMVRTSVIGHEDRAPNNEELEEMKTLVAQGMKEGAFGISTGLSYPPGCFAKTDELIELSKVVAKYGGFYATHMRRYNEEVFGAIKETIEIGEKAGLPVHISHLFFTPPVWGQAEKATNMLEEARERGVDITFDMTIYLTGGAGLNALLPDWAHAGGLEKLVNRLKDLDIREKIKKDTVENGQKTGGTAKRTMIQIGRWDKIWLADCNVNEDLCGKSFVEIAKIRGVEDPFDAVFDILIEEKGYGSINVEDKIQPDYDHEMRHHLSTPGSDGSALAPYGILGRGRKHPRNYGTFPRVLARYVRERNVITLEAAIRKMTSASAQRLGLYDRGLLKPGMWADIVIFDQEKVMDKATDEDPYKYPEGILYVLVNGRLVIENEKHTSALPGKVLRHKV